VNGAGQEPNDGAFLLALLLLGGTQNCAQTSSFREPRSGASTRKDEIDAKREMTNRREETRETNANRGERSRTQTKHSFTIPIHEVETATAFAQFGLPRFLLIWKRQDSIAGHAFHDLNVK
jgi:hypothetical protein